MTFSGVERGVLLVFFGTHIPITLLIDAQAALPAAWFPQFARDLVAWHTSPSGFNDSLMRGPHRAPWFRSIVACEVFLQLPFFFLILHGVWHAKQRRRLFYNPTSSVSALHEMVVRFELPAELRAPSLLYAAHVATTMVPILAHFMLPGGGLPLFGGNPFADESSGLPAGAEAGAVSGGRRFGRAATAAAAAAAAASSTECALAVDSATPWQRLVLALIYAPYLLVPCLLMRIVLRDFPPLLGGDESGSGEGNRGSDGRGDAAAAAIPTPLPLAPVMWSVPAGASSAPKFMIDSPGPRRSRGAREGRAATTEKNLEYWQQQRRREEEARRRSSPFLKGVRSRPAAPSSRP